MIVTNTEVTVGTFFLRCHVYVYIYLTTGLLQAVNEKEEIFTDFVFCNLSF